MDNAPLSNRVAHLCQGVSNQTRGHTQEALLSVAQRLREPLRVAIAGRLKSGKSTLVNALIERRVAPTDIGECTRVVTQFLAGSSDIVSVVQKDNGEKRQLPLDKNGEIPGRLGVTRSEISHLEVSLTIERLKQLRVIDTPGLASTNSSISDGTKQFLFADDADVDEEMDRASADALAGAEAMIYVFTQAAKGDDLAALDAFRSMTARGAANPINSIGILNKVDQLGAAKDPWPEVTPIAHSQAESMRQYVADVVPLVGLLAETTLAGRLTAADCENLRTLANLSAVDRTVLMASGDLFVRRDAPVSSEDRERLLSLLDLYGIHTAFACFAENPQLGTGDLVNKLHEASGFPRVRERIEQTLASRADPIKAAWALTQLDVIASRTPNAHERELLRNGIEEVMRQPEYHQLRVIEAAQNVAAGHVEFPAEMTEQIRRLAVSTNPAWVLQMEGASAPELHPVAVQCAAQWRTFAVSGASPAQARVADVIQRGFHLMATSLKTPKPPMMRPPQQAPPPQQMYAPPQQYSGYPQQAQPQQAQPQQGQQQPPYGYPPNPYYQYPPSNY